jgi:hypothetical protein
VLLGRLSLGLVLGWAWREQRVRKGAGPQEGRAMGVVGTPSSGGKDENNFILFSKSYVVHILFISL